jgi:hypothetical protein
MKHTCKRVEYCLCSSIADEPNEECPFHGWGEWPPRCMRCGRFMKSGCIPMAEEADLKSVQCAFDSHGPDPLVGQRQSQYAQTVLSACSNHA